VSVGRHLDDAARALQRADDRMRALAQPDGYDLIAAVAGRDQLYREIGRFLSLANGRTPREGVTMQDAVMLLGPNGGGSVDRSTVLTTGITAATLNLDPAPADLLRGRPATASLAAAATSLGIASEILATHSNPPAATVTRGSSRSERPRFLTREAAALFAGAQRPEALGEAARLTAAAMRLDAQLLDWRLLNSDVLRPDQWQVLRRWLDSGYPAEIRRLAAAEPAVLLRHLQPAPVVDRPSGPREITSWADAVTAAATTRSAIHRNPQQATIAVTRAVARLGFAATAAGWRLSGRSEPTPRTAKHADQWREFARSLDLIADVRDKVFPELASELDLAKNWVRVQVIGRTNPAAMADIGGLIELQQEVQRLCAELRRPLARAKAAGHLLTSVSRLDNRVDLHERVVLAVPQWDRAEPNDPQVAAMFDRLQAVAGLSVSVPLAGALHQVAAASFTTDRTVGSPRLQRPQHTGQPRSAGRHR